MPRRPAPDWPALAAQFGTRVTTEHLHPRVVAWTRGRELAVRKKWAVAFSGGADSLALLLVLWAHWPERREKLWAMHFNHRLRGRAADEDEAFCREVCAALGISFIAGRWENPPARASEAAARVARMEFFAREMTRSRTAALWLGHQLDDVAETILMRLARGSGTAGLAAPRPLQPMPRGRVHVRPLLTLAKREIIKKLRECRLTWREDATNATDDFFRNRLRSRIIPAWRRAAGERDALAGAALSRELLEEDDQALDAWLAELRPLERDGGLRLDRLAGKPRGLVRRALYQWLLAQPQAGELSRQGFASLLRAVERGTPTRHSLGVSGFAVIRRGVLRFARDARIPTLPRETR